MTKHQIIKFTESNSSFIRTHSQSCDRCEARDIRVSFAIIDQIGDDVDTFEFSKGEWTLCENCVKQEMENYPERYHAQIKS